MKSMFHVRFVCNKDTLFKVRNSTHYCICILSVCFSIYQVDLAVCYIMAAVPRHKGDTGEATASTSEEPTLKAQDLISLLLL